MNSQVCVICRNEKPVNSTNNRLVTESCGHMKCMDCLLQEKSGCRACLTEKVVKSENGLDQTDMLTIKGADMIEIVIDCGETIKKKKPETSHIRVETDADGRYYLCTVCKKKFHARSQVAYHAYCNGQRKPFQCPECSKSFATHSHFKYHMRVHRNERTYACEVCGDSFFQMSKLQRHKLKHTKEKKFVCQQCNKGFSSLSSLRKHDLTHTEVRPFVCAICNKRFRDTSNYRKHVAKHEEGKKCKCTGECNSMCAGEGGGEACGGGGGGGGGGGRRAHQCPRCPRAFHSRKDMRRHLCVHTDSKPFRCKVCNRRFRRKDNLERHIRNTHPAHVPASAVECDLRALRLMAAAAPAPATAPACPDRLKTMNPLPPLPKEVIQNITEVNENVDQNRQVADKKSVIDKSYILEANNARQSVIVGKCTFECKVATPQDEYVHKIRKANSMASQKNVPLPPIDEKKIIELEQKTCLNNLDVGAPPKDVELYKKILYEKTEIDVPAAVDEDKGPQSAGPEMHWRRKMKLNINWNTHYAKQHKR